jgi:hypothetical protein
MGCCYSFLFGETSDTEDERKPLLGQVYSDTSDLNYDSTGATTEEEDARVSRAYEAVTAHR